MTLPKTKTPPKDNLSELTVLIYGRNRIGKTTLCADAPKAVFLATEAGLNGLEAYQVPINSWQSMLSACQEVAEGKHEFRTVIIDTVDNMYQLCSEAVCAKHQVEHEADLPYGKGWALVNGEFQRVLTKLSLLPYGLWLVSQAQDKEIETRTGKLTKIVCTLPDKARKIVMGMSDLILYADLEPVEGADGKTAVKRVMRTQPTMQYDAGVRSNLRTLPETIDLSYAALTAAWKGQAT